MNAQTQPSLAPLFELGNITATPRALALLASEQTPPVALIRRHVFGDWGACCEEDAQANRQALADGERIMSVYAVGSENVWVITEADRSATTLLLPEEY